MFESLELARSNRAQLLEFGGKKKGGEMVLRIQVGFVLKQAPKLI